MLGCEIADYEAISLAPRAHQTRIYIAMHPGGHLVWRAAITLSIG